MHVHEARARAPREFIIGASVSCAADAILAVQQGANYVVASPVFPTASKPDAGVACGIAGIRQIKMAVDVPVVAIGGIGLNNVREFWRQELTESLLYQRLSRNRTSPPLLVR